MPRELGPRLPERFPLGEQGLVYDTTTSSPCSPPFHRWPRLPQRGTTKQKRTALRQRALALVVDDERGLPLDSRGAEGAGAAVVALGHRLQEMVGPGLPQAASARLTRVLDQGHVSRDTFQALTQAHCSCLAAIPAGWVRPLSQGPLKASQPLVLPDGRSIQGYCQPHQRLAAIQGPLLGRCSPRLYRPQGRTLALLQRQAAQQLLTLHAAIPPAVARQRPRTAHAVQGASAPVVRPDRLQACFAFPLCLAHKQGQAWRWPWDQRQQRALKHHHGGQTGRFPDRRERAPQRMGMASRSQAQGEARCRISQSQRPGVWWPASPWTESTLAVQALSCFVALLLLRLGWLRLHARHLALGADLLTERLRGLQEARGGYANGTAPRGIPERRPEQEALCIARD